MNTPQYPFRSEAARTINSGQSHSLIVTGNIQDLFCHCRGDVQEYVPLIDLLVDSWSDATPDGIIPVVYELNGPIRFPHANQREVVKNAWMQWRGQLTTDALAIKAMVSPHSKAVTDAENASANFDQNLQLAIESPTLALELLRQLCCCSRSRQANGKRLLVGKLLIIIEGADLLLPESEVNRLNDADRRRVSICQDWFADPGFLSGGDAVVLLAESRSSINSRISRSPVLTEISVPLPDVNSRTHFVEWFRANDSRSAQLKFDGPDADLINLSAGLSLHALRQLLVSASYTGQPLRISQVVDKVEQYIRAQLGDDMVEFKHPQHRLDDLVGFEQLKAFLRTDVIPRLRSTGDDALPGAAVAGPLGSGKTFIFEAVAAELGIPVLVIKGMRSMWFGQTDVLFERFRRVIDTFSRVLIFVDEADTQFGGVGADSHETERRLTGKIQAMMSDTALLGKVSWLLMTARIHLLSPDIRRPGRVGDLIIPVLDPEGADHQAFVQWVLKGIPVVDEALVEEIVGLTTGWSSASFASLRRELSAIVKQGPITAAVIKALFADRIPPAIDEERRLQTLYALINCTRKSLLPPSDEPIAKRREGWSVEIRQLESFR